MPDAPRQGFLKGLFGGGPKVLDREELFGESNAGKASSSLAKTIPGARMMDLQVCGLTNCILLKVDCCNKYFSCIMELS